MHFQLFALFVLLSFYGIYLWKMRQQKKQGIKTDQIGKGKKDKRLLIVEWLMKTATYAIIVIQLVSIFLNFSSLTAIWRYAGLLIGLAGVGVFALAIITMRDSWRAGIPEQDQTQLVSTGIYAYSRNPAFLGFYLMYIGLLLLYFNWLLVAFTIWAISMLHLQVLQEENFLAGAFGDAYRDYADHVHRYIGRKR